MLNGATGPFGRLLYHLEMLNPVAFRLPLDIRDHFEGVRTGPDGEYEEGIVHKARYVLCPFPTKLTLNLLTLQ